jgi:hypothetical protein
MKIISLMVALLARMSTVDTFELYQIASHQYNIECMAINHAYNITNLAAINFK